MTNVLHTLNAVTAHIKDTLVTSLFAFDYANIYEVLTNTVNLMAQETPNYSPINSYAIYYQGKYYINQFLPSIERNSIILRHEFIQIAMSPKYKQKFIEHINEISLVKKDQRRVEIYLNYIFNLSRNLEDIKILLPASIHQYAFKYIKLPKHKSNLSVTSNTIEEAQEKFITERQLLKERVLLILLNR